MRYRKKPVVVEAMRLPQGEQEASVELLAWLHASDREWYCDRDGGISIETLEGPMRANPGDWIIKGLQGEMYPCKPDIFEATYEPAS